MKSVYKKYVDLVIILGFGLSAALICQFFVKEPTDRYIHMRNFRYGKDPAVIRCNRGGQAAYHFLHR